LSNGLEKYCRLKGKDRLERFLKSAYRKIGYVIQKLGDRSLDTYSSSEAATLQNWLSHRNNSTPIIKRVFPTVRNEMNLTIQENRLNCTYAFSKTFMAIEERPKNASISPADMKSIQVVSLYIADERRFLCTLISGAGMRLSEKL
jgi:hypothetical protein